MCIEHVTLIFSGVVTASTVVYVILTSNLVKETRKSREFFLEANIVAYLSNSENDPSRVYLNIKNIGKGVARDVSFKITKDIDYPNSFRLNEFGIFKRGMRFLPPDYKLRYFLLDIRNDNEKQEDSISFNVIYKDSLNKVYNHSFTLCFNEIEGMSASTPPDSYIGMISYRLEKIEKILKEKKD